MIEETLKYHIALQEKFRERMGKEQIGDRIYDPYLQQSGFVSSIDGDRIDYINEDGECYWTKRKDIIPIPLPIDPRNPERGLWGMVDWTKLTYDEILYYQEGRLRIRFFDEWIIEVPELALLKALAHQWKVEVR